MAYRPFITDDSGVVGYDRWQLEVSLRTDRIKVQNLNIWRYGITEGLEATLGWSDGYNRKDPFGFSITGPLVQLKYQFLKSEPRGRPGVSLAVGANPPWGTGAFKPEFWNEFVNLALTEDILGNAKWLWHGNVGLFLENRARHHIKTALTWGIATEVLFWKGLSAVGEIVSGDPFSSLEPLRTSFQTGLRYVFNANVQADAAVGSGLRGDPKPETYAGIGLTIVFGPLFKRPSGPPSASPPEISKP